jgi:alginate O-acetyltransferase complex protein AlgI
LFAYAFAFQIYCDFAAYSTIARGVARLFGVNLMRNFLTPYLSSNPSEFWSRWHISLSTWLRDYLYIPLGGNQHGPLMTMRNLMITMFLGGLWHGAGFFFIVWGIFHGLLLVLYRLVPVDVFLIQRFGRVGKLLSIVLFFHLVCIGWIFFRATPEQFLPIVRSIVTIPQAIFGAFHDAIAEQLTVGLTWMTPVRIFGGAAAKFMAGNWMVAAFGWGVLLFMVPVWVTDYLGWKHGCEFPDLFVRMPLAVRVVLILALIYGMVFFARREANEFIYFAF